MNKLQVQGYVTLTFYGYNGNGYDEEKAITVDAFVYTEPRMTSTPINTPTQTDTKTPTQTATATFTATQTNTTSY